MNDPAGPVRDLRRRLADAARAQGLELEELSYQPDLEGGPDEVEAVFCADVADMERSPDDVATSAAFDNLTTAQAEHDRDERAAQVRAELARRVAEGGDLLG